MKATLFLSLMLSGLLCFGQNQFEWIYPNPNSGTYQNSGDHLYIKLKVFNPPYDAKYDVLVNGKSIYENSKSDVVALRTGHINTRVPLRDGNKSIVVTMTINNTTYKSKSLTVVNKAVSLPRLFLLAVGATPPDIDYTVEDAEDIYNIFTNERCGESLYSDVIAERLVGTEAKASDILAAIKDMTRGKDMLPSDVFILYISSHGKNINGKFHIQGSDYTNKVPEKTTVAAHEIYDVLDEVSAKKLLFFDACESGTGVGVKGERMSIQDYRNYIINSRTGYSVITSSKGTQQSYYHDNWQNGAFTEALLEGLRGRANYNNDEVITTNEIFTFLSKEVPKICGEVGVIGLQNPDIVEDQLGDFPFFDGLCSPDVPTGGVGVDVPKKKPSKSGSYIFPNGDGYKGNWKNEQMHGEGTYHYQKTGERYIGTWKNDYRNGEGQLFNAEGNLLYDGNWSNDMRNGEGIYFYDDGSRYIGGWKNNQQHGTGKHTIPDEGYYKGKFKKGKYSGFGIFYHVDGSRYEGKWKNGKKKGRGKWYNR